MPSPRLAMVGEDGRPVHSPHLREHLRPLIERRLGALEGLCWPVVLKVLAGGGAWLYAYADEEHAIKTRISARALIALSNESPVPQSVEREVDTTVGDLAANFESRQGEPLHVFGRATRNLSEV